MLLLAFLRQQEAIANELVDVARYMPRLRTAQAPLGAASRRLRAQLRTAETVGAQGVAVQRYAVELRRIASRLEKVDAPRCWSRHAGPT